MKQLIITSEATDALSVSVNGTNVVNLHADASHTIPVTSGDKLTLSLATGSIDIDATALAKDFDGIMVIDDANGKYKDWQSEQALGSPNSVVDYSGNKNMIFISFSPLYSLKLAGKKPGSFQQIDGSKYLVKADGTMPSSSSNHYMLYFVIFIVLVCILGVLGVVVYKKRHHIAAMAKKQ